jgi:hypothetical protein
MTPTHNGPLLALLCRPVKWWVGLHASLESTQYVAGHVMFYVGRLWLGSPQQIWQFYLSTRTKDCVLSRREVTRGETY